MHTRGKGSAACREGLWTGCGRGGSSSIGGATGKSSEAGATAQRPSEVLLPYIVRATLQAPLHDEPSRGTRVYSVSPPPAAAAVNGCPRPGPQSNPFRALPTK